jgi:hypothetical protein
VPGVSEFIAVFAPCVAVAIFALAWMLDHDWSLGWLLLAYLVVVFGVSGVAILLVGA